MYIMITAYDALDQLHVRVVCTEEIKEGTAEAMHVAWKAATTQQLPAERSWPDCVALVAELALDLAYDRR